MSQIGQYAGVVDPASFASTFTADNGQAQPAAGNLNIIGGDNVETTGAGDNILIDAFVPVQDIQAGNLISVNDVGGTYTVGVIGTSTGVDSIGIRSDAVGGQSIAIGVNAVTPQNNSIAIGANTTTNSTGNIAIGILAEAISASSISIGSGSEANNTAAIALGLQSFSSNTDTIAIGGNASATGTSSIGIGVGTDAINTESIAIGSGAEADGSQSLAVGSNSRSHAPRDVSIGESAGSANTTSVAGLNIYLRNVGVNGEDNTMRLGDANIDDTYIDGIYNATASNNPLNVFAGDDGKLFTQNIDYVEGVQAGDNVTVNELNNVYTINATSPVANIIGGTGIDVNVVGGDYTINVSDFPVDDIQAGTNVTVDELNGVYTINAISPVADIQGGTNITVTEAGGVYTINASGGSSLNLLEGNLINIVATGDDRTIEVIGDSTGLNSVGIGSGAEALGDNQLAIGNNAGSSIVTGGTDSIYLRNNGVDTETNTMRLGDGQINNTYVSGIYGSSSVATNDTVLVGDDGKLFGQTESAFLAFITSDITILTTNDPTPISFGSKEYDNNDDFSVSTNQFTAPVDGIYEFKLNLTAHEVDISNREFRALNLIANSTPFAGSFRFDPVGFLDTNLSYVALDNEAGPLQYSYNINIKLDQGDFFEFESALFFVGESGIRISGSTTTGSSYTCTSLSGRLIKQL